MSLYKVQANRSARILSHLRTHRVASWIIIGLFIVYLPILYQISLNLVAAQVTIIEGRYCFVNSAPSLFPIPFDAFWIGSAALMMIRPLTPIEIYIYSTFYPSIVPRVMWSILWLTIGITYIIWPLLSSPKTKENTVNPDSSRPPIITEK
jgi:hypothetical protein